MGRSQPIQKNSQSPEFCACYHLQPLPATHERAFRKFTAELRTLRNEKRKSEIGFESQERKRNEESRKQAAEQRKRELHKWAALTAQAAYEHQELKNVNLETPECRIPNRVQRILAADQAA